MTSKLLSLRGLGSLVDLVSRQVQLGRVNAHAFPNTKSGVRHQLHDQVGNALARDTGARVGKGLSLDRRAVGDSSSSLSHAGRMMV